MKTFYLLTCCFCFSVCTLQAQKQPEIRKRAYVDSAGRFYQQADLPTYILVATAPDETPTALHPSVDSRRLASKAIQLDGHGVHNLSHYDANSGQKEIYQIYADGMAPVSSVAFQKAPHYAKDTRQYYGKNLTVVLTARDEMSGLNGIFHSLNEQAYTTYAPVSFAQEGSYTYRYYATDNVGNAERVKTNQFIVDLSAPRTYHNIVGISSDSVISTNSTIYLTPTDSLSGVAETYYRFDNEKFKPYSKGNIAFQYLNDGEHTLTYYSIDHVTNQETVRAVSFYLDKTAPITSADVLGDRFLAGNKVYFSGRTKLKLTAVDNKSGIKRLVYSIDKGSFVDYQDPFYLPNKSGIHSVDYYAVDNTENTTDKDSYMHNAGIIYVDLTGPILSHSFTGEIFQKGDTTYIGKTTQLQLAATDPESGLQYISYSVDNTKEETRYKQPFALQGGGLHTVNYFGYDNVNNRNISQFLIRLDDQAPEIYYNFSVPLINEDTDTKEADKKGEVFTYPSYLAIFVGAADKETGVNTITYSINKGPETPYALPIRGFKKRKEYTIKVTATDLLGNKSTQEIRFRTGKY